jgi:hypothetical protein
MKVKDIEDWLISERHRIAERYEQSKNLQERESLRGSEMTCRKLLEYIRTGKRDVNGTNI